MTAPTHTSPGARFRAAVADEHPLQVVGAINAYAARMAAACGFKALYLSGGGVEKDLARGRELSELGCERGDAFGCFNAGVVYAGGSGVTADPAKAAEYYDRACKAGDGEGCHELAAAYAKGNGVTRDARRSKELDQKACELGFTASCGKKR